MAPSVMMILQPSLLLQTIPVSWFSLTRWLLFNLLNDITEYLSPKRERWIKILAMHIMHMLFPITDMAYLKILILQFGTFSWLISCKNYFYKMWNIESNIGFSRMIIYNYLIAVYFRG